MLDSCTGSLDRYDRETMPCAVHERLTACKRRERHSADRLTAWPDSRTVRSVRREIVPAAAGTRRTLRAGKAGCCRHKQPRADTAKAGKASRGQAIAGERSARGVRTVSRPTTICFITTSTCASIRRRRRSAARIRSGSGCSRTTREIQLDLNPALGRRQDPLRRCSAQVREGGWRGVRHVSGDLEAGPVLLD